MDTLLSQSFQLSLCHVIFIAWDGIQLVYGDNMAESLRSSTLCLFPTFPRADTIEDLTQRELQKKAIVFSVNRCFRWKLLHCIVLLLWHKTPNGQRVISVASSLQPCVSKWSYSIECVEQTHVHHSICFEDDFLKQTHDCKNPWAYSQASVKKNMIRAKVVEQQSLANNSIMGGSAEGLCSSICSLRILPGCSRLEALY